ncbi:NAD(P)H-dependent oxidoreductase [Ascidiimonas sp. W6]|uniref:NAD(P)H-dependent oxidoreductase n=1 Tax=Ascidiimonas meishanensis TaxID=3128903 RepID=UPI0030EF9FE3
MSNYIKSLEWRYATKKFDPSKKVSSEYLETLKNAIQLTASSYGLQPYEVLIIDTPEIREKLQAASWGQSQVVDASHLFIFCNKITVQESFIDDYLNLVSSERDISIESLKEYGDFMKSKITSLSSNQQQIWTAKQVYIALGNLLSAAAELKIDACPMEGFEAEKFDEILGLKEKGLNAAVMATIGYRSDEDATQHYKKVRRSQNELFTTL